MISNILPIVALAGAAMAACPLSVEITGATAHVAQVAVTNTGAEALTVFKGNTVLSPHATKDILVSDAGILSLLLITHRIVSDTSNSWSSAPIRGCLRQLQAKWTRC
jgi:hypothetical protein